MTEKINLKEWVNQILNSEKTVAIPIMTHPGIDLIGKKVIDAVTDGIDHFQAIQAINNQFPSAASTLIMDLTVEAEAFGCEINFPDNEVPSVANRLVSDRESVEKLNVPDINSGRIQQYLTAARLSAENSINKPVFAGCIGPFSLSGRLFDMTEIMTEMCIEPDVIEILLQKCTAFLIEYINEFKKAGANGVIMAEPAAGLLSEDLCDLFSSNYVKQIVEAVQDDTFMLILHNCGNKGHLTQSMVSTGAKGLHFGNSINMAQALEEIPSDILVLGNLDPVGVFKFASPEEVEKQTTTLLEQTRGKKNFIISSGCDTPPGVPFENIKAFYKAVEMQ
ncbi:MAG TPA: uroporphyrinogen decarboxylase family protein [Prolixibacteraceae bacterium]|nr:uroporphyrinogen decarboxylase family protein [Prolixibacteraceae bacterium]